MLTLCVCVQVEVENFVLKMAAEFPSRRDQLIFLINNYDMMLSVLMVRLSHPVHHILSNTLPRRNFLFLAQLNGVTAAGTYSEQKLKNHLKIVMKTP